MLLLGMIIGSIAMGILSGLPILGPLLAGFIAGVIAGGAGRGALAGFFSGILGALLATFLFGAVGSFIGGELGALLGSIIGLGLVVLSLYAAFLGLVGGVVGGAIKGKPTPPVSTNTRSYNINKSTDVINESVDRKIDVKIRRQGDQDPVAIGALREEILDLRRILFNTSQDWDSKFTQLFDQLSQIRQMIRSATNLSDKNPLLTQVMEEIQKVRTEIQKCRLKDGSEHQK